MALIYWGEVDAASDITMAFTVNTPGTSTRAAIIALITPIAADIIANDPTVAAAAAAAVEAKLAAENVSYTLVHGGQSEGFLVPVRGAVTYNPNGGPFGTGAVKRAVSGTASVVSLANAVPEPSGEVTITDWLRLDTIPTGQNRVALAIGTKIWIGAQLGTGNLMFSAGDTPFASSIPIADGEFHFVEAAFSRISGVTRAVALHVDGVAVTLPASQTSQAWDSTLSVLGFASALPQFDWPGEVGNFEIFRDQRTSFEVPTSPNSGGGRTIALAQLDSSLVQFGTIAYPPRPDARAGMVTYVGRPQPTTWLPGDRWIQT